MFSIMKKVVVFVAVLFFAGSIFATVPQDVKKAQTPATPVKVEQKKEKKADVKATPAPTKKEDKKAEKKAEPKK
jgi:hypothetical protein